MASVRVDPLTQLGEAPLGSPTILRSAESVILECKRNGVRLSTRPMSKRKCELSHLVETGILGHDRLVRLCVSYTNDEINYIGPDDMPLASRKSNWLIPCKEFSVLTADLEDDTSDVRRLSDWAIDRAFVYIDVSDFSKHTSAEQAMLIGSLIALVRDHQYWCDKFATEAWKDVEAMLCIGDGYIFVLKRAVHAVYFAARLAWLIEGERARRELSVPFHFRIGAHVGPVFCFWDWGRGGRWGKKLVTVEGDKLERTEEGDWNYIGAGINGGQRVLAAVGKDVDDVVFISGQLREALKSGDTSVQPASQMLSTLVNRGRKADKHQHLWRVYEVNHTSICEALRNRGSLCDVTIPGLRLKH